MLLTDRWFNIPQIALNHSTQNKLKADLIAKNGSNFIIAAGRRSYKTERFCKRYAVQQAIENKDWVIHLGAPTIQQAKTILWGDVKKLSPSYLVKKTNETDHSIEYVNGTVLRVIGLKEFKRAQGGLSHLAIITEMQDTEPDVYNETFEPMLNDTGGIFIGEGRPFGKNHFYDFYLREQNGIKGWKSYHWKSSDILTSEQIERAKQNLALKDYEREYDASFETEFGAPYYAFKAENNRKHILNTYYPIIVACDFNATDKPMSWVIGQRFYDNGKDITCWTKCLSSSFTNTEQQCENFIEYIETLFPINTIDLIFYGDFAGNQERSNSSFTDWEIIERRIAPRSKSFEKRVKFCKSIRDSIGATNAQLCNALGIRKQFLDFELCRPLALDYEKSEWAENQRELKDKDPLRGHSCRAVDYFNDYEHNIKGKPIVKQF